MQDQPDADTDDRHSGITRLQSDTEADQLEVLGGDDAGPILGRIPHCADRRYLRTSWPLPRTRTVGSRRCSPDSVTRSSSASQPPVSTVVARARAYTGSPQAS